METQILEDLGLTKAEIKVYIALLELGNSSAGAILDKSKLQKSDLLRELQEARIQSGEIVSDSSRIGRIANLTITTKDV